MSTTMNTTQSNNENFNDVFVYDNKDRYYKKNNNPNHLRDQLKKFLSKTITQISNKDPYISSHFSALVDVKKIEMIQNLENQIVEEEYRITGLEKAKEQKLTKVLLQLNY